MKLVINVCFGGFSLSPFAIKRIAELKGRPCYFFNKEPFGKTGFVPVEPGNSRTIMDMFSLSAFDVPNPDDFEERDLWNNHHHDSRPEDRSDPHLVQAVEELGEQANGPCAKLKVVEIPDGIEWEIDDYDGQESVQERHRSWR